MASDSRYALLTEPRLQALLPVQVLGVQQRDGLPELEARYGVPLTTGTADRHAEHA